MDFIKKCFDENSSEFAEKLTNTGFSVDQAEVFLPETATSIMQYIKNAHLEDVIKVLLSDDPSQILNSVDTGAIVNAMGINSDQVTTGFEAIAPVLSKVFTERSNEIVDATASLAWSPSDDLLDSAMKVFN